MSKNLKHPGYNRRLRLRAGFTLAELIVSVGVLALMMSMAGAVFHLTLKSTGEAKAVTTIAQRLRLFEETLRADLRGVSPENGIVAIVPMEMNAYWASAGRDGDDNGNPSDGYPHPADPERETLASGSAPKMVSPRADRLMFVTVGNDTSRIDPTITGGIQVVTYSHAILGEWEKDSSDPPKWVWRLQYGESDESDDYERRSRFDRAMLIDGNPQTQSGGDELVFPTPAQDWHLARRRVLLVEYDPNDIPAKFNPANAEYSSAVAFDLDDCIPDAPNLPADFFECMASDTIPRTSGETVRYALVEGRQDVVASPVREPADPAPFMFYEDIVARSPQDGIIPPQWYSRSELDLTPPAPLAQRLGDYLLAHCASFKVEFAIDLPELRGTGEVLWFDPADLVYGWNECDAEKEDCSPTRMRLKHVLDRIEPYDPDGPITPERIKLEELFLGPRFTPHDPADADAPDLRSLRFVWDRATGQPMSQWFSTPPEGSETKETDPLFPVALRVTIDVYDDEQRLERPTRHVMVFKIGS
ncbi:MAG: type II secretion system protein [Phycisphaerae bacterium]|nr:type II secretion system protein [Phycisphaerae bacterium]